MMYVDFHAGDKDYKLRLNLRNIAMLEKQLGCNPLAVFGKGDTIPTVTQMVQVLYYSLIELNHGISLDDAYNIFEQWLEDGNIASDFIYIMLDIYKTGGLIKKDSVEKNT